MKNAQNEVMIQKDRIRKIKTQHNQSANIDYGLLFQQTKKLHKNQIQYAKYADNKTDTLFPLKPVQIGFIQSLTLKDDPKFKQVRNLLQKYNQQVIRYNQKSAPGLHLKTVVVDSMVKFMRLMLQAPDATAKKRILDVAYYWFKKNIDVSKQKRRNQNSLQKQIRKILVQSNLVPKSIIDRQLPSQKQKQELHNYHIKARTRYSELNAPVVQLQNYITHKLGFANQGQKNENDNKHSNKEKQEIRQQKWKKRIIFKRPYIQQPNYQEIEQEQLNQNQNPNIVQQSIQQNIQIKPNVEIGDNKNDLNPTDPLVNPQQVQQNQQDLQIGIPDDNEPDDQPQQVQQEQVKQKRGKLDPLVKIFLLDRNKKLKTQGEVSADHRYNLTRNWKVQQKKLDQINQKFVTQWAGNRSRFKSQLSRKIQFIRAFTSISKAKQENNPNPIRVEDTINKVKLNQTLKQYGAYLQHEPVRQTLNTEKSMSLYDKKRSKTQASQGLKPFSSVLQDRKRLDQKSEYLQQIHQLKEKFAKYKLYTPLDNFKKAIIHPEQKQCNWAELDKAVGDRIELPRCQMISNPFAKFAKKKKKKGKKKN